MRLKHGKYYEHMNSQNMKNHMKMCMNIFGLMGIFLVKKKKLFESSPVEGATDSPCSGSMQST